MLHVPLLSDAYAAALFGAAAPRSGLDPEGAGADTYRPVLPEPSGAPDDDEREGEEDVDTAPSDLDDIETARTRPLRLDRIHL